MFFNYETYVGARSVHDSHLEMFKVVDVQVFGNTKVALAVDMDDVLWLSANSISGIFNILRPNGSPQSDWVSLLIAGEDYKTVHLPHHGDRKHKNSPVRLGYRAVRLSAVKRGIERLVFNEAELLATFCSWAVERRNKLLETYREVYGVGKADASAPAPTRVKVKTATRQRTNAGGTIQLQRIFQFNGYPLTSVTDNTGKPWFLAKDIAKILGINNAFNVCQNLDASEKRTYFMRLDGGGRNLLVISGPGLISLTDRICSANKPGRPYTVNKSIAKLLRRWVINTVLPTFRKSVEVAPSTSVPGLIHIPTTAKPTQMPTASTESTAPAAPTSAQTTMSGLLKSIFQFNGHDLTAIIDEHGQPWFVGNEVAKILGYKYPKNAIRDNCKYAKLLKGEQASPLTSSPYGIIIIPESDLYRLITRSKLPSAEKFEDWITETVLPTIRKTGGYGQSQAPTQFITKDEAVKLMETVVERRLVIFANARMEAIVDSRLDSILGDRLPGIVENITKQVLDAWLLKVA